MSEPVRAVVMDLEGSLVPARYMTETLIPYAREHLGGYISAHADDEALEDALDEAGRLMGGFSLKPAEAEALLLRWMKQDRKVPPLKLIQGWIWQEGFDAGSIKPELHADVADTLRAWQAAGLRLFVYSSLSTEAQRMLLAGSPAGDLTPLFEGFLDTAIGQRIEPTSYTAVCEQLALPAASILAVASNEEELDAAREAGLATAFVAREPGASSRHRLSPGLAALQIG